MHTAHAHHQGIAPGPQGTTNPASEADDPCFPIGECLMRRDEILQTLARFRERKQDEFGIVRIGVFGSVARGEIAGASDVDVVVELVQPDLLALVGIKQELEDLLQEPVDVVRYRDRMNPFLKRRIEQEAVYV
jgi:predicted nucleotidyltransferase